MKIVERKIILFCILAIVYGINSCKKEESPPVSYNIPCSQPIQDSIISKFLFQGNWKWISEYYTVPFTGNVIIKTPATEGYSRNMTIDAAVIEFFKNDTLEAKFKYNIEKELTVTNYPDDSAYVLVFYDYMTNISTNYVHFKICNDSLRLNFDIRSDIHGRDTWSKQ